MSGPDARRFLHGMVTNDIKGLQPGQGCHAALLTVKGKMLGDLVVYDCGDWGLLLELVAGARAAVQGALDRHLIMDNATIEDVSAVLGELEVYGDGAAAILEAAGGPAEATLTGLANYHAIVNASDAGLTIFAATRELGTAGFHVIAPGATIQAIAGRLAQVAPPLDDDEATVLRVEAGTPLYGIDIDEDRMPQEAGLDDAMSFTKGCYLGQEVVVRLRDRGHLNRKLCGLTLVDGGPPPAAGTLLRHAEKPNAGVITSAVASPRHGTIALGYVHRTVFAPGTELELVSADEKPLGRTAVVTELPFAGRSP